MTASSTRLLAGLNARRFAPRFVFDVPETLPVPCVERSQLFALAAGRALLSAEPPLAGNKGLFRRSTLLLLEELFSQLFCSGFVSAARVLQVRLSDGAAFELWRPLLVRKAAACCGTAERRRAREGSGGGWTMRDFRFLTAVSDSGFFFFFRAGLFSF